MWVVSNDENVVTTFSISLQLRKLSLKFKLPIANFYEKLYCCRQLKWLPYNNSFQFLVSNLSFQLLVSDHWFTSECSNTLVLLDMQYCMHKHAILYAQTCIADDLRSQLISKRESEIRIHYARMRKALK